MSKVLLVADANWVANQVRGALALGDWAIEQVTDPRQTLERVQDLSPDTVIVDMQVGSMGGMAVIRALRSGLEARDRPHLVLLLDRSADDFIARRAGADACVLKPINTAELRQALNVGAADEEE
jgi:twitching motility two-component system response regulator PilH